MAPRRHFKKGTLSRALDDLDCTELSNIVSGGNGLDRSAVMLVMKKMRQIREECMDDISPLQAAISLGYFDICKHLIEEGASLRTTPLSSMPHPLCLALKKGHYHIARLLINTGADIRLTFSGMKPMYFALENNSCTVQIIEDIIKAGFLPNETIDDTSGITSLHLAVSLNRTSIVKYLLSIAVDPNVKEKQGFSPLHTAVDKDYPKLVKLLVKNGAKIDNKTNVNCTPLFLAITNGNYKMVKLLISLGADIHHVSGSNKVHSFLPLQYAASLCQLEICQLLIEKGADVKRVSFGETALNSACMATDSNKSALDCVVQLLIKEGADLEARSKLGVTPLMAAFQTNNISVAKILITSGAKINLIPGGNDASAFHFAVKTLNKDLIKLCLDYGGNYLAVDVVMFLQGILAASSCPQSSESLPSLLFPILKLFWKHGLPLDEYLNLESFASLATRSNVATFIGTQKILFKGLEECHLKTVKKAISAGATVTSCSVDIPLPIHYLSTRGNHQIIKEFVSRGVNVNFLNKMRETPIHLAARWGHIDCCKVLLEHGAVYNYCFEQVRTPLEIANTNGHTEIVKYLAKVDSYFKALKKGNLKKLRTDMKVFNAVMNCCHRDGMSLMGRAIYLNMRESADHLMKLRLQMSP